MSQKDKILKRLRAKPKDFTWNELIALLNSVGYVQPRPGKTGGSRRRFIHPKAAILSLHQPHPGGILKCYQIEDIIETLEREELI
jgi:hypothetical protein